jgi:hypothetical protein
MTNPVIENFNTGSLVLRDGFYQDITLNAPGAVTYPDGQVLAFDASASKWKITKSGTPAVANAKAILRGEVTFSGAGDKLVRAVIKGHVNASRLVFDGSDTLDTIPGGEPDSFRLQLRDYEIIVEDPAEQTFQDNHTLKVLMSLNPVLKKCR